MGRRSGEIKKESKKFITKIKDMKTISKNLRTKSGAINNRYSHAWENSVKKGNRIYPKSYTGSGNYITLRDYSFQIEEIIKDLGYKFKTGNDAPRGGKQGDFIQVSKTAMNAIIGNFSHGI